MTNPLAAFFTGTHRAPSSKRTKRSCAGTTRAGFWRASEEGSEGFSGSAEAAAVPSAFLASSVSVSMAADPSAFFSVDAASAAPDGLSVSIADTADCLSFSASFFAALALAFAVVLSTAAAALAAGAALAVDSGGGYANRLGRAALVTPISGILRSPVSATSALGTSGSDRKYTRGYQYQYWVKTARPTMALRR